jgi:hypothetical protein
MEEQENPSASGENDNFDGIDLPWIGSHDNARGLQTDLLTVLEGRKGDTLTLRRAVIIDLRPLLVDIRHKLVLLRSFSELAMHEESESFAVSRASDRRNGPSICKCVVAGICG